MLPVAVQGAEAASSRGPTVLQFLSDGMQPLSFEGGQTARV